MNADLWKQVGLAVLAVVYTCGMVFAGYSYAMRDRADAVVDSLDHDKELVDQARVETKIVTKQVVKYVDRIKTIHDNTGCADVPAEPAIADELHKIRCATKGCEAD